MQETLDQLLRVALEAATAAGREILAVQQTLNFKTLFKEDGSPATDGDTLAERKIIEIIRASFPRHRLIGEELGEQAGDSAFTWVFDPIDGTWSFLNQETTACVNVAVLREGEPVVAVVYNPFTGELYQTTTGQPTTLNGTVLPVTRWETLGDGVLNYHLSKQFLAQIQVLIALWQDGWIGKLIHQGGAPAYSLALTAKGAHSIFIMGHRGKAPDPWTFPAGALLVRNAGGRVTDLAGRDIDTVRHSSYIVAASHPRMHEQTLQLLAQYGFADVRVSLTFNRETDCGDLAW